MIAFQGGWMDITEPTNATVVKEDGLGTFQSCVYNKQTKKWIWVVSHQMPLTPGTQQYPRGKYHEEYRSKSINDPRLSRHQDLRCDKPGKSRAAERIRRRARPALASTVLSTTVANMAISHVAGTTSCAWRAPSASTATA